MQKSKLPFHPLRRDLISVFLRYSHSEIKLGPYLVSHLAIKSKQSPQNSPNKIDPMQLGLWNFLTEGRTGGDYHPEKGPKSPVVIGGVEIKWMRHTEFCSYTFISPLKEHIQPRFDSNPLDSFIRDGWEQEIEGDIITAIHIIFLEDKQKESDYEARVPVWKLPYPDRDMAQEFLHNKHLIGSYLGADRRATLWTDLEPHEQDEFGRIVVIDKALTPEQRGKLANGLTDIVTYRMMAMQGLSIAKSLIPKVRNFEEQLADFAQKISSKEKSNKGRLLKSLSKLAQDTSMEIANTNYRFSASKAYKVLVEDRLAKLDEWQIPGLDTIKLHNERSFIPAMHTIESVAHRLENVSRHIAEASDLLRTEIELDIQEQNKDLLASLDKTLKRQTRLQQAVERFAFVAISYYIVKLLQIIGESLIEWGIEFNQTKFLGLTVIVIMIVLFGFVKIFGPEKDS